MLNNTTITPELSARSTRAATRKRKVDHITIQYEEEKKPESIRVKNPRSKTPKRTDEEEEDDEIGAIIPPDDDEDFQT